MFNLSTLKGPPKRSSGKPAKQPVARPDESVRQPDVHSGGDGDKQDVVWFGVKINLFLLTLIISNFRL